MRQKDQKINQKKIKQVNKTGKIVMSQIFSLIKKRRNQKPREMVKENNEKKNYFLLIFYKYLNIIF